MIDFEIDRASANLIYHQFNDVLESGAHFHPTLEFTYVTKGTQIVHINKNCYNVKKGEAVLILPGEIHWYEKTSSSASYLCIFSSNYVSDFINEIKKSELVSPVFQFQFENMIKPFIKAENVYIIKAFLNAVIACACKAGLKKRSSLEDSTLIYRITEYIDDNYKNEISLKQMAYEFGYNYTYLSNFFNSIFPQGFSRLINEYRVNYAKKLLTETSLTMTQISINCGFPTIRTFNRAFLQLENTSPKEYRNNTKKHG